MKTVDPLYGVAAFLAVAECQSFTGGAERLGLTRATVSAQVAELEARLGVRLLHRSTRAVRLTPAGQAFRDGLSDLPDRVAGAERAARAEHGAPEGRLRLTAPPGLWEGFLAPWTAEFVAMHPAITLEIDLSDAPRNLIEGRFDLAVRAVLAPEPNLVTRKLGESPMVACATPGYLARRGAPLAPQDLAEHDILHFAGLRRGRLWVFSRGEERVEVPVTPRIEVNGGTALRMSALEGAGIVLLPTSIVGGDMRAGRLQAVLQDWDAGRVPLHAVYPDNRQVAQRVKAFVAFLARKAKDHPDLQG